MICPRCSVSAISPVTGKCDLCGYSVVAGLPGVVVEPADTLVELATKQLAHEFTLGELVGRGRDSVVHRAREIGSGRAVVLKVILRRNAEADVAEAFRALMATLSGFDHPHLIPVVRHGSTDSLFWFATEDRGSVSLAQKLHADGPIEPKACRRLLTQIVSALDYLHRHGLVHGAVKAENVLIDRDGWVRLADPNFVRPRWRRPTRPTPVIADPVTPPGTPIVHEPRGSWVAPEEIARGERLPAADQYALAVLTIECLTGAEAESVIDPLALLSAETPPRMRRALERALDEIPTRRVPGVTDFLWALEEDAAATMPAPMRRVTTDVVMVKDWEAPPDPRRSFLLVGRIVAGLLVAAAVLFVTPLGGRLLSSLRTPPPRAPVALTPSTTATPSAASNPRTPIGAPRPVTAETTPRPETRDAERALPPSSIASRPVTVPTVPTDPPGGTATATAAGRLFVNASPWGQVFVDGALIGNTPRASISLTAGSHTIRVSRTGFVAWERTVRVEAGETLRFTDIVLTPERP